MKRISRLSFIALLLVCALFVFNIDTATGQVPPPPPNGGPNSGHGLGGNQAASQNAPLGGGLGILMVLGSLYLGKKVYASKNNNEQL
ncbi:MAG: hypothetical protein IPH45_02065 [Bacteroidales bacterium]|nr:hypothetical protein [Bacteroidales bacterium]